MNDLKVTPEFVDQLRDDVMAMYATTAMKNRLRALILDWQRLRAQLDALEKMKPKRYGKTSKTRITKLHQLDFIPDGVKISFRKNDRDRYYRRLSENERMAVDDGGGFNIDQEILDESDCFVHWLYSVED